MQLLRIGPERFSLMNRWGFQTVWKTGPLRQSATTRQRHLFVAFMAEKGLTFAVRCNFNCPAVENIRVKTTLGQSVSYRLLSIPVYLSGCLDRLMKEAETANI